MQDFKQVVNEVLLDIYRQKSGQYITRFDVEHSDMPQEEKLFTMSDIENICRILTERVEGMEKEEENKKPVEKIIFVEDGSVDIEELEQTLTNNPEIKYIIYRQGSCVPLLTDLDKGKVVNI